MKQYHLFAISCLVALLFSDLHAGETASRAFTLANENLEARFVFDGSLKLEKLTDIQGKMSLTGQPAEILRLDTPNGMARAYRLEADSKADSNRVLIKLIPEKASHLKAELEFELSGARLTGRLSISNSSPESVTVTPTFPSLQGITMGTGGEDLWYCLPHGGGMLDNRPFMSKDRAHSAQYGDSVPMQFMDFYSRKKSRGMVVLCLDTQALHKLFLFGKKSGIEAGVSYPDYCVGGGEKKSFPAFAIQLHDGDWHRGIEVYQDWVKGWHKPVATKCEWLRKCFLWERLYSFDQAELNEKERFFSNTGHITDSGKWYWGEAKYGDFYAGFGDYPMINVDPGVFKADMRHFREAGSKMGVFLSPGLTCTNSLVFAKMRRQKQDWSIWKQDSLPIFYRPNVSVVRTCFFPPDFRQAMADRVKTLYEELRYDFIYWDCLGYSVEGANRCYHPGHGHAIPCESPLAGQMLFYEEARKVLPKNIPFMTEFRGGDVYSQYIEGCISHLIVEQPRESVVPIDLFRFCFPKMKHFTMFPYVQSSAAEKRKKEGNSIDDGELWTLKGKETKAALALLDRVLFNGEAVWTHRPERWIKAGQPEVPERMGQIARVMAENWEAFDSLDPKPLVPTEQEGVFANYFPAEKYGVFAILNLRSEPAAGRILKLPDQTTGASIRELWGNCQPKMDGRHLNAKIPAQGLLVVRIELCEK
ncbi:MAG: DUF6259 domain-containing protein [Verrucomicrobiae bacterium]|nr:DUF6259 domain-containing protein [Verrucomicrobiae bacterium]